MKRSTLTLSILTALLVSACGGSSSNDEQTKDPTPPKVTPTNPGTPSTGRTPTTGKKEPKKEEEKTADSSEPTPPISSGSAPSGGKPIVITGEPKEENKPDEGKGKGKTDEDKGDGKTDEDQNKDKDKDKNGEAQKTSYEEAQSKLKAAQKKAIDSASEAQGAQAQANVYAAAAKKAAKEVKDKAGIAETKTIEEALVEADKNPAKKDEVLKAYNAYLAAQKTANEEQAKAAEKHKQAKTDADAVKAASHQVDLSKVDDDWKDKPAVQSVKDAVAAEKNVIETAAKKKELTDEENILKEKKKVLVGEHGNEGEKKKLETEKEALEKLLGDNKDIISPETKDVLEKAIVDKKAAIAAIEKEVEQIESREEHRKAELSDATKAAQKATDKKGDVAKYSINLGVAGVSDFTDSVFMGVQKAEKSEGVWTITFDAGENAKGVTVNKADWTSKALEVEQTPNKVSYGKFGKIETSEAAYKTPEEANSFSIYGYFDNKFYSVGQFANEAALKDAATKRFNFKGTSFLEGKDKQKMVSTVEGDVDFEVAKKGFTGKFKDFYTYDADGTLKKSTDEALAKPVIFNADITGSSFKPSDGSAAKVYGYFYGSETEVKEAGGLVEHEAFHGSFGGKTGVKQ